MENNQDKRKEKVAKAIKEKKIIDNTSFTVFQMVEDLHERLDSEIPKITDVIERMKGDKGDSPTEEELLELIKPLIPEPIKGEDGKDYQLTDKDKKEIAKSIEVPVVEKEVKTIVEKTEVIRETPIVTENIVEKALYEEPNQIVAKINASTYFIDNSRIKGFADLEKLSKINAFNPTMGPSFADLVKKQDKLIAGSGITITNNVISSTGGGSGTVTSVASADGSITVTNPTTTVDLAVVSSPKLTTARTIAGVSFDGTANISIASTGLSDTANIDYLNQNQTLTGIKTFTPTARSSGTASYFTINAPADTGITAATESKGINIAGATRTWVDGTTTTQREYYFGAPTYNKTTTSATFTNAATVAISGAPTAGSGVTITHPWSLWVQAGNSHFGAQIGATQTAISGSGAEFNDSNNTTGGHIVEIQNTSNGTSAFSGVSLGNDQTVDGGATTHFGGLFWNSSTYTDTTFGTAFAIASLLALQNSDGPVTISAQNATGYINFITGGSASTNEVGRFTTTGLTVGLTGTLTGAIKFAGGTSTSITLQGQAVGSSSVLTLPIGTDTLVGKATTDVLTNKDLTSGTNTFPTFNQNTTGSAATLTTTRTLWGQNFNGSANVTGSLTSVGDITGGASNMAITAGTGNSRTLTLKSTTSGGTATAFLTGNADQSSTFGGNISGTGAWTLTGGAGNMTIVSGTGNSRTMILQTTTSGGTATTALTLNADQTATFAAGITAAGATTIGTGNAFTCGTIELGAASDTTLARVSAGVVSIEGATIATLSATQTFTGQNKFNNFIDVNNAITASSNAATVPVTFRLNTVTNDSAGNMTITMTTTNAVDGQMTIVRILDFSAVAKTITWVNTENSTVTAPTTSNGSTTLFLTVGFIYNGGTSKWRCIASA